jgi:hypothetical protein
MSDIVERLRDAIGKMASGIRENRSRNLNACLDAADEILNLRIALQAKETEAIGYLRAVGELQSRVASMEKALERQGDNMALVINHAGLPQQWYEKFRSELEEDRAALDAVKER